MALRGSVSSWLREGWGLVSAEQKPKYGCLEYENPKVRGWALIPRGKAKRE